MIMDTQEIILKPVGMVRSEIKEPTLRTDSNGIALKDKIETIRAERDRLRNLVSIIEIEPELEDLLEGIEGHSHLILLYWAHKITPESRKLTKVHPMGLKDIPKKGIFATCSPARPNPILVTTVRLLEREGNCLKVQGLEAIDGSPVIDIKPFAKGYHNAENPVSPEWMEDIHKCLEGDDKNS